MADKNQSQNASHRKIISLVEAREQGLTRFFTGKPCKRGHIAESYTSGNGCVECSRQRGRRYLDRNPTKLMDYYYEKKSEEPDFFKNRQKLYRLNNTDEIRKYSRQYYKKEENRQKKLKYGREYRLNNKEKSATLARLWVEQNREKAREIVRRRRARKRMALGSHSVEELSEILRLQHNRCAYCRRKFNAKVAKSLDHILAISRGGSEDRRNLQYLCSSCNSKKSAKDAIDYVQQIGLLI